MPSDSEKLRAAAKRLKKAPMAAMRWARIHGSAFCPRARERDNIACARLLLEAGARLDEEHSDGYGNEEMASFLERWNGGG